MLYRVQHNLTQEETLILSMSGFQSGEIVWCHGTRKTAHGEYGRISKTYESRPGHYSPTDNIVPNMPMRYFVKE